MSALRLMEAGFHPTSSEVGKLLRVSVEAIVFGLGAAVWLSCKPSKSSDSTPVQRPGPTTFNRDVAPILFQNCAPCHRPSQSAPFSLLNYADALKHAKQIVEVTQKHYMPPWLPEPGYGEFVGERRLAAAQIETLQRWLTDGASEGDSADLPPLPKFAEGWQLGEPDLIVQVSQPYTLAAEGKDIYRNFVIPAPVKATRFVRALEFHPNNKSVHHVRILLDATRQSRRIEEQDPEPGFAGMTVPAKFPPGHMLTWALGRSPRQEPAGLEWVLEGGADVVLQIHMQRTGKPELIQPAIGFYFTDKPPTKSPYRLGLLSELIDISAGEKNYLVERTLTLPADVDVLGVMAHMHYLGKRVEGFATLPNGKREWLLFIKDWDFNWQDEYRYQRPVFLPEGSVITMRYTYDNSAANARNPNQPPRRVVFGPQSADEMGELWLQVLPRRAGDLPLLQSTHRMWGFLETAAYYEHQLRADPNDARAHFGLGKVLGPLGQMEDALRHFQTAVRLQPNDVEANFYLGLSLYELQRWHEAKAQFETTLRLKPDDFKAHDAYGRVLLQLNDPAQAAAHFRTALQINPDDPVARGHLEELGKARIMPEKKN